MKRLTHVAWLFDGWLHVHAPEWAYPAWRPLCDWVDRRLIGEGYGS